MVHSIIRAFRLQQRLQNEREEEWFHLGGGRSWETSHHSDTSSSSSLIHILCFNALYPISNHQNTSLSRDHIRCKERRVLLTTTAIHHCYLVQHHHYGDLSLVCCPVSSTRALLFAQTQTGRPGRIYSEHWQCIQITILLLDKVHRELIFYMQYIVS